MIVYLGSYTDEDHPNGLKVLNLNAETGSLSVLSELPVSNALYQALSSDGRYLYSCTGNGLASFRIAPLNAHRSTLNSQPSTLNPQPPTLTPLDALNLDAKSVCHVVATPDRVLFAEYLGGFGGSVQMKEGRFGAVTKHQHTGSGPNLPRQSTAHCHQTCLLPNGGYVLVDLGLDELVSYPLHPSPLPSTRSTRSTRLKTLTPPRVFKMSPAGAGPRHLLFHPNGHLAFLVSELGNLISTLRWDAETGFHLLDTLSTLPLGDTGRGPNGDLAAAIRLTPDLKQIVVSNRGENSLVSFDFDEMTGRLAFKGRTLLPGSWPRDFIFVTETLALAAMERSGEVHTLRYETSTGKFEILSTLGNLFRPVALTVAP